MNTLLRLLKTKRGVALATVVVVFATVAVLGTVTATVAVSEAKSAKKAKEVTAAQYLARSAVDIVSTQLENKLAEVDAAQSALLNALPDQKSAALDAYEAAKTELDASGLIPSSYSNPASVIVSGITDEPVTVYVSLVAKGGADYLEVNCTVSYDGSEGNAKARVSSIAEETSSITISSYEEGEFFWSGDAIYSWGDITVKNNAYIYDGGTLSAGGTITGIEGNSGVMLNMPVLIPPSWALTTDKTSVNLNRNIILSSSDSGYYGAVSVNNNRTWSIDTTAGDVILIFDSLTAKNNFKINIVYGENRLYIYLIESLSYTATQTPTSNTLLECKNGVDIVGTDSDGKPLTYVIAYNDSLQQYYQTYGSNVIPAESVIQSPLDIVTIKNGQNVEAYFYLPCCAMTIKNNSSIKGVIYTGEFEGQNNTYIYFRPMPGNDLFEGFSVVSSTPADTVVDYVAYIFNENRVWLN